MAEANVESLIEDLLEKKERLNQQANRHRDLRDRLNDGTRVHAGKRDELNGKVRALIDKANHHKQKRDELNVQVRAAKDQRDVLNRAANEKAEALNVLKRSRGPGVGNDALTISKLKAEVRRLEYEQQTKVLAPKKEKELIDRIGAMLKEIKEKEKSFESDDSVKQAYEEMKKAKAAAEDQHKAVTELANAAQAEHDSMVKLFEEADTFRKEADGAQDEFIKSKMQADTVHHEYIEMVNQIRDVERVGMGLRGVQRREPRQPSSQTDERRDRSETRAEAKAEAENIFDKFKKGEKLSTEDLMALQKAGLL